MTKSVLLPFPPKELNPNARIHWAKKSKIAKKYRNDCCLLCKQAGLNVDDLDVLHVFITFYPPNARSRDDDNLIAAFKNARDGIADAIGVDDKHFKTHPLLSDKVVKGGAVEVIFSSEYTK